MASCSYAHPIAVVSTDRTTMSPADRLNVSVGQGEERVLLTGKHKIGSKSRRAGRSPYWPECTVNSRLVYRFVLLMLPHRARLDLRTPPPPFVHRSATAPRLG